MMGLKDTTIDVVGGNFYLRSLYAMRICYGLREKCIDVTMICIGILNTNGVITIPWGEHNRIYYFTDPVIGSNKKIFIVDSENRILEYDNVQCVHIDTLRGEVTSIPHVEYALTEIHRSLKITHGTFHDEVPEQRMVVRFLTGNEKVLEIGGNIGRNSLVIAAIQRQAIQRQNDGTGLTGLTGSLVTLECDSATASQLRENRDINGMTFHVEEAALSKRPLVQTGTDNKIGNVTQVWDVIQKGAPPQGYTFVKTIRFQELEHKYHVKFDTLVLDCEGAFYYILQDMPEILKGIQLIIMENDYHDILHKQYVDDILHTNGFVVNYRECGGWGPCYQNFYEVWKKV